MSKKNEETPLTVEQAAAIQAEAQAPAEVKAKTYEGKLYIRKVAGVSAFKGYALETVRKGVRQFFAENALEIMAQAQAKGERAVLPYTKDAYNSVNGTFIRCCVIACRLADAMNLEASDIVRKIGTSVKVCEAVMKVDLSASLVKALQKAAGDPALQSLMHKTPEDIAKEIDAAKNTLKANRRKEADLSKNIEDCLEAVRATNDRRK